MEVPKAGIYALLLPQLVNRQQRVAEGGHAAHIGEQELAARAGAPATILSACYDRHVAYARALSYVAVGLAKHLITPPSVYQRQRVKGDVGSGSRVGVSNYDGKAM